MTNQAVERNNPLPAEKVRVFFANAKILHNGEGIVMLRKIVPSNENPAHVLPKPEINEQIRYRKFTKALNLQNRLFSSFQSRIPLRSNRRGMNSSRTSPGTRTKRMPRSRWKTRIPATPLTRLPLRTTNTVYLFLAVREESRYPPFPFDYWNVGHY